MLFRSDAYGPAVILMDETLHYVDKVSQLVGVSGNLADNTVAFLREMTDAVRTAPRNMMVVSLTASSLEQLSSDAMHWLDHLNQQVAREDTKHTPVERTEVHDIVRRRLFESVDEKTAARASQAYHDLYINTHGLPSSWLGDDYAQGDVSCNAYVARIDGQCAAAYAALAPAATQVRHATLPPVPRAGRFRHTIQTQRVTIFYAAPPAVRPPVKEKSPAPLFATGPLSDLATQKTCCKKSRAQN